jgi:Mrp family chromosome partitioning ATPase
MDLIRQAIERTKRRKSPELARNAQVEPRMRAPAVASSGDEKLHHRFAHVDLNPKHLESRRIIAHDVRDPRSKSFDILRTQVLRTMEAGHLQLLAVTSPTPGCGKTLTAINLALSIARQPDRPVLLVDLDLQRPQVAACLGFTCNVGVLSMVEGRTGLQDAVISARIGDSRIAVLPTEQAIAGSSEWMTSAGMRLMMQSIRQELQSWTVILDMPPVLTGDDVIAILPQIDCALLVAAAGKSMPSEIQEAANHLHSTEVIRLVLNKVPEAVDRYYY